MLSSKFIAPFLMAGAARGFVPGSVDIAGVTRGIAYGTRQRGPAAVAMNKNLSEDDFHK